MGAAAKSSRATTSIRLVWPFVALAKKHGYDISGTAARLGLTPAQLEDPETRVPQRLIAQLLQEAVERSGERDLGLIAARYVEAAHVGIGEYLARTRPTLRAAIEQTGRYLPLLGDDAGHSLERSGKRVIARIWFSPELQIHESAYEFVVALGVLRARRMTGIATLAPIEVRFMHQKPASTARHEKLFLCPVRFGADSTQVVMSAEYLEMRLHGAEPALGALLERQADAMLAGLPRARDLAARVRAVLAGLDLRRAGAEHVAQQLGMSVRTLARKLDDEGTSYREQIDTVRRHAALRELAQEGRPIAEIADRLGFASSQSFHRAFRRWTGTTASACRRRMAKAGRKHRTGRTAKPPQSAKRQL